MNATEYAHMVETGEAPCGCHVEFSMNEGNPMQTVMHTCDESRQEVSEAANKQAIADHMERQERKMLMSMIPMETLRAMVHGEPAKAKK